MRGSRKRGSWWSSRENAMRGVMKERKRTRRVSFFLTKRGKESQKSKDSGPKRMGRLTRRCVSRSSLPNCAAFPGVKLKMRKFSGVSFQSARKTLRVRSFVSVRSAK